MWYIFLDSEIAKKKSFYQRAARDYFFVSPGRLIGNEQLFKVGLVPCSYLLIASNTAYLNRKGTLTYKTTKVWQNWKKFYLLRTSISIGVWDFKWKYLKTQNIWACLWNRHNLMNLVLSFQCECNHSHNWQQ